MKNLIKPALGLLITGLMVFFSCAPAYVPNVLPSPLLGQEGDLVVSAHTGIAGFDPQVAYGITDHAGVMINGSFRNYKSDTTLDFHNHTFMELGGGYFTEFLGSGRFEVYAGGGAGTLNAEFDNPLFVSYSNVFYSRAFVQPTVGLVTDLLELSFSPRIVFVTMMQDGNRLYSGFLEPAVTGKLGYRNVKGVMQMGISVPLRNQLDFFYQPFIFSLGLQVRINVLDL